MIPSHSMIEPIVKNNFGNKFRHQNGSNKCQSTYKNIIQQHQHRNTSQEYQQRNTSQHYQHRNTSQQYKPISFQRPRTLSITYLKENCVGCGIMKIKFVVRSGSQGKEVRQSILIR